ncbi:hypothetical protein FB45DRAFT_868599 [Roridomyces roridus]|uniref:Uncharacterized protein n=1 Tax=Roridomyces roridus TaxID=1738132 RepID=A0AAD7BQT2_9AGAR|nr:hypothetical protein FB45DRAFT_868599 [Roridomyces roridus]
MPGEFAAQGQDTAGVNFTAATKYIGIKAVMLDQNLLMFRARFAIAHRCRQLDSSLNAIALLLPTLALPREDISILTGRNPVKSRSVPATFLIADLPPSSSVFDIDAVCQVSVPALRANPPKTKLLGRQGTKLATIPGAPADNLWCANHKASAREKRRNGSLILNGRRSTHDARLLDTDSALLSARLLDISVGSCHSADQILEPHVPMILPDAEHQEAILSSITANTLDLRPLNPLVIKKSEVQGRLSAEDSVFSRHWFEFVPGVAAILGSWGGSGPERTDTVPV